MVNLNDDVLPWLHISTPGKMTQIQYKKYTVSKVTQKICYVSMSCFLEKLPNFFGKSLHIFWTLYTSDNDHSVKWYIFCTKQMLCCWWDFVKSPCRVSWIVTTPQLHNPGIEHLLRIHQDFVDIQNPILPADFLKSDDQKMLFFGGSWYGLVFCSQDPGKSEWWCFAMTSHLHTWESDANDANDAPYISCINIFLFFHSAL